MIKLFFSGHPPDEEQAVAALLEMKPDALPNTTTPAHTDRLVKTNLAQCGDQIAVQRPERFIEKFGFDPASANTDQIS